MTEPTHKQQYLDALQTRRDIDVWLDKPRCCNCERYQPTGSTCTQFGIMPQDAAFAVHGSPCPSYQFDDIPF